jgi:hypothetical protein
MPRFINVLKPFVFSRPNYGSQTVFSVGQHKISDEDFAHPFISRDNADGHLEHVGSLTILDADEPVVATDGDQDDAGEGDGDEESETAEGDEPSADKPRKGRARKA